MLSGADAFAEELDPEGVEGSDTETGDEWLSFCDTVRPPRLCESRILMNLNLNLNRNLNLNLNLNLNHEP